MWGVSFVNREGSWGESLSYRKTDVFWTYRALHLWMKAKRNISLRVIGGPTIMMQLHCKTVY